MATEVQVAPAAFARRRAVRAGRGGLGLGVAMLYMSIFVLVPLAAVVAKAVSSGAGTFWDSIDNTLAIRALVITMTASLIVAAIGALMGTLVAWVLVRDTFPGKRFVNALIDLPFALPTIVAGLTLLAFYGPNSPVGIDEGQPGHDRRQGERQVDQRVDE